MGLASVPLDRQHVEYSAPMCSELVWSEPVATYG